MSNHTHRWILLLCPTSWSPQGNLPHCFHFRMKFDFKTWATSQSQCSCRHKTCPTITRFLFKLATEEFPSKINTSCSLKTTQREGELVLNSQQCISRLRRKQWKINEPIRLCVDILMRSEHTDLNHIPFRKANILQCHYWFPWSAATRATEEVQIFKKPPPNAETSAGLTVETRNWCSPVSAPIFLGHSPLIPKARELQISAMDGRF